MGKYFGKMRAKFDTSDAEFARKSTQDKCLVVRNAWQGRCERKKKVDREGKEPDKVCQVVPSLGLMHRELSSVAGTYTI